jgi:lipopolysaccharide/colanic/teichoic acid biosynthesis glycosyltransferase
MKPTWLARKRRLDLVLLLLTLPFWGLAVLLLALLVRVCDGAPIFFAQPRVGQGGRPFRIWKLRSMTTEAAAARRRPTRFGGWLRHHGLDELPQLWNVLRGDMSLCGPRPLTPDDLQRLAAAHPGFAARLALPPGITGLPQICVARGAALTAALDEHYARRWTAAADLAILLRTAWINLVGKRRGARPLPEHLGRVG